MWVGLMFSVRANNLCGYIVNFLIRIIYYVARRVWMLYFGRNIWKLRSIWNERWNTNSRKRSLCTSWTYSTTAAQRTQSILVWDQSQFFIIHISCARDEARKVQASINFGITWAFSSFTLFKRNADIMREICLGEIYMSTNGTLESCPILAKRDLSCLRKFEIRCSFMPRCRVPLHGTPGRLEFKRP